MEQIQGHLVLIMAPSGSGKKMMVDGLGEVAKDIYFAKTFTSRAKREGTEENPKYNFITSEEFEALVAADEFVEWANFSGNLYGTPKSEILETLSQRQIVLKEMELQGVQQIKKLLPAEHITIIYVDAGEWHELEKRIVARAAISDEELELRRQRYEEEAKFIDQADIVIQNRNGEGEKAQAEFKQVIIDIIQKIT